ncbi:MAG: hypothetical protein ACKODN_11845 [Actinomycetota bacterium]
MMSRPHVVADVDRQMADDATTPPDETAVADAHHGRRDALLPGHHARRQSAVRPEHRVVADLDVVLVVDGHPRKRDE